MQDDFGRDELASERTILAAERTFSAWVRTGLAALGGGLAIVRAIVGNDAEYKIIPHVIGGLLVLLGASIFVYAIMSFRRSCMRLSQKGLPNHALGSMFILTVLLLIISALVFWLTLK